MTNEPLGLARVPDAVETPTLEAYNVVGLTSPTGSAVKLHTWPGVLSACIHNVPERNVKPHPLITIEAVYQEVRYCCCCVVVVKYGTIVVVLFLCFAGSRELI